MKKITYSEFRNLTETAAGPFGYVFIDGTRYQHCDPVIYKAIHGGGK